MRIPPKTTPQGSTSITNDESVIAPGAYNKFIRLPWIAALASTSADQCYLDHHAELRPWWPVAVRIAHRNEICWQPGTRQNSIPLWKDITGIQRCQPWGFRQAVIKARGYPTRY